MPMFMTSITKSLVSYGYTNFRGRITLENLGLTGIISGVDAVEYSVTGHPPLSVEEIRNNLIL